MRQKSAAVKRNYLIIGLILIIIAIGLAGVIVAGAEAGAAVPAPTATPGIVQATATPVHVHLEWGQELHILCSETSVSPPSGILNADITGSDNVRVACRAPFTAK